MERQSWGKSERSNWFFLGQEFVTRTVFVKTVINFVFSLFESRHIQNFQLKVRKENGLILSFFAKNLPKRLIFLKAYNIDKEEKYSPSDFWQVYYDNLEDLETSNVETETRIRETQEAIDYFINKKKSTEPNKKTATDAIVNSREWLWNSTKFFVVCYCSVFWPWPRLDFRRSLVSGLPSPRRTGLISSTAAGNRA